MMFKTKRLASSCETELYGKMNINGSHIRKSKVSPRGKIPVEQQQ